MIAWAIVTLVLMLVGVGAGWFGRGIADHNMYRELGVCNVCGKNKPAACTSTRDGLTCMYSRHPEGTLHVAQDGDAVTSWTDRAAS